MELIQLDCAGVALGLFYRRLQFLFMYGRPPLLNVFTYLIKSIHISKSTLPLHIEAGPLHRKK